MKWRGEACSNTLECHFSDTQRPYNLLVGIGGKRLTYRRAGKAANA
jgi:hypothetical protein